MPTAQKYSATRLEQAAVAQHTSHVHQPVRSGALTILITVVVVSLAVLSVLALSTAKADLTLTTRHMQSVQQAVACESAAQEWLMHTANAIASTNGEITPNNANELLGNILPNGTTVSETGLIEAQISASEKHKIVAALQIDNSKNGYKIVKWKLITMWEPDEGIIVWDGK